MKIILIDNLEEIMIPYYIYIWYIEPLIIMSYKLYINCAKGAK